MRIECQGIYLYFILQDPGFFPRSGNQLSIITLLVDVVRTYTKLQDQRVV